MGANNWSVLIALLFGALSLNLLTVNAAISCYTCQNDGRNSAGNQLGCEDPGRLGEYAQDCALAGQDRCMKIVGPGNRILRTCAGIGAPVTASCNDNGGVRTCTCFSNLCNAGRVVQATTIVSSLLPVFLAGYRLL